MAPMVSMMPVPVPASVMHVRAVVAVMCHVTSKTWSNYHCWRRSEGGTHWTISWPDYYSRLGVSSVSSMVMRSSGTTTHLLLLLI